MPLIHAVVEVTAPIGRVCHKSRRLFVLRAFLTIVVARARLNKVVAPLRRRRPVLLVAGRVRMRLHHVSALGHRLV